LKDKVATTWGGHFTKERLLNDVKKKKGKKGKCIGRWGSEPLTGEEALGGKKALKMIRVELITKKRSEKSRVLTAKQR